MALGFIHIPSRSLYPSIYLSINYLSIYLSSISQLSNLSSINYLIYLSTYVKVIRIHTVKCSSATRCKDHPSTGIPVELQMKTWKEGKAGCSAPLGTVLRYARICCLRALWRVLTSYSPLSVQLPQSLLHRNAYFFKCLIFSGLCLLTTDMLTESINCFNSPVMNCFFQKPLLPINSLIWNKYLWFHQ